MDTTPTASGLRISRRSVLIGSALGGAAAALPLARAHADNLDLVVDGQARCVIVPREEPAFGDGFEVEVEDGVVTAPMRVVEDPSASGGAYVDAPAGNNGHGSVEVTVDLPTAGEFTLWVRMWGPSYASDSFTVTVAGGPPFEWITTKLTTDWTWFEVGSGNQGSPTFRPEVHRLPAGPTTVVLGNRESGARADAIRLVPTDHGESQLAHATQVLADTVETGTGARLAVVSPAEADDPDLPSGRIYLGWGGPNPPATVTEAVADLDPDGYVIAAHDGDLMILGRTDWGTRYGVYEFLERHAGVRWLMPGPDGTDIPELSRLSVPDARRRLPVPPASRVQPRRPGRDQSLVVVDGPSFASRSFSPLFLGAQVSNVSPLAPEWTTDDARVMWATTNRTHSTLTYRSNHNMSRIFPPRTYADPDLPTYHPEYYPIRDGQTVLPALTATSGWQPRFDLDATAEVAIDHVLAHFADNPELDIFSLAINDGGNSFSDTDLDTSIINSEGYASASESYYRWVNQVVTGVIDRNPDLAAKTFPVLAYTYVADPPSFDLHPQIVPMVTVDSGAWVDPVARTRIKSRFTSWQGRARRTAWYDYSSGTRYVVPRPYLAALAEAYAWGAANGVEFQYADMYPDLIGEGPKTWMLAKLLWNIEADPDDLIAEWYEAVAGPGASDLAAYFAFWDDFWTDSVVQTPFWAYSRFRTYVYFPLCTYLDVLDHADVVGAGELLDRARDAATTDAQRARIDLIRRRHEYVERSVRSYPHPVAAPTDETAALSMVSGLEVDLAEAVEAATQRRALAAEDELDPVTRRQYNHDTSHFWTGYNGETFFHLHDWIVGADGNAVRVAVEDLATTSPTTPAGRFCQLLLEIVDQTRPSVLVNGDFESGDAGGFPPWTVKNNARPVAGAGLDGSTGLELWSEPGTSSAQENSIIQQAPAGGGLLAGRIWFRLVPGDEPIDPQSAGLVSFKVEYRSDSGALLRQSQQPLRFARDGGTDWAWLAIMEDVPRTVDDTPVARIRVVASLLNHDDSSRLILDEAQVFTTSS